MECCLGWGFFFAFLAMVIAAVVEVYRLKEAPAGSLDSVDQWQQ